VINGENTVALRNQMNSGYLKEVIDQMGKKSAIVSYNSIHFLSVHKIVNKIGILFFPEITFFAI